MNYQQPQIAPFAKAAIQLLKGPVFNDQPAAWDLLLTYQTSIKKYFEQIALQVIIDQEDGYAYLKQMNLEDESTIGLVRRTPLSYDLTLVCVLLREWLHEFEREVDQPDLYITPKKFRERIEVFFKEKANELKFIKQLNRYLDECTEQGLLKRINNNEMNPDESLYLVRRMLKARINLDELHTIKNQLENELKPL